MKRKPIHYEISAPDREHDRSADELQARWSGRSLTAAKQLIHSAIKEASETSIKSDSSVDLPEGLPEIMLHIEGKPRQFLDLRGFNFSSSVITNIDLTYCCFDYANFFKARFERTQLQFSTFRSADLSYTNWIDVQASPISACNAKMKGATFLRGFFMHSDFTNADLSNAEFRHSHISQAIFDDAVLHHAKFNDKPLESNFSRQSDSARTDRLLSATSDFTSASQKTVMVVDDSRFIRDQLERQLGDAGFRVTLAIDGEDAMRHLKSELPDMLVVDIEMPHMNGIELTQAVRRGFSTRRLPVIVITSHGDQEHRRQSTQAGATEFFTKPLDERKLLTCIEGLLRTHRG